MKMGKRISKAFFFSALARGLYTVNNLVIFALVGRGLGVRELGLFGGSFFFYNLAAVLSGWGMVVYFGKETAYCRERQEERNRLVGENNSALLVGGGFSLLLALLLPTFYKVLSPDLLFLAVLAGVVTGWERNLSGFFLGEERMVEEFFCQLLLLTLTTLPLLLWRGWNLSLLYVVRTAAFLLVNLIKLSLLRGRFPLFSPLFRRSFHWKETGSFLFSEIVIFLEKQGDLFILTLLIAPEALAAYFLAMRIYQGFCLFAEVANLGLTPFISRSFRGMEELSYNTLQKISLWSLFLFGSLFGVFLFLFRRPLAALFSPESASQTATFLLPLSLLLAFRFVSFGTGNMLTATRHQPLRFVLNSLCALVMLVGFVLGGKFYGVWGILVVRIGGDLLLFLLNGGALIYVSRREALNP